MRTVQSLGTRDALLDICSSCQFALDEAAESYLLSAVRRVRR